MEVRSDSLKVGCICQVEGSFRVYAEAPFFDTMRNGPVRLLSSFFLGHGRLRLVVSSHTLSPT